ncbi:MAG: hypothetical protein ACTTH5_07865, partial [Wolinella sp.]
HTHMILYFVWFLFQAPDSRLDFPKDSRSDSLRIPYSIPRPFYFSHGYSPPVGKQPKRIQST